MDVRQITRSPRMGKDALQLAGAGRSLVPRRECGKARRARARRRVETQPVCRANSRYSKGSPSDVIRAAGEEAERELRRYFLVLFFFSSVFSGFLSSFFSSG